MTPITTLMTCAASPTCDHPALPWSAAAGAPPPWLQQRQYHRTQEWFVGTLLNGQTAKGFLYWGRIQKPSKTVTGVPVHAGAGVTGRPHPAEQEGQLWLQGERRCSLGNSESPAGKGFPHEAWCQHCALMGR